MLVERWNRDQIMFTVSGLVTWYVAYVAFRNLKSYVPFVTDRLADPELARLDRLLWLGNDPAVVLHDVLGTSWANWVMAAVYLVWIGLVPASLAIALVWTRRSTRGGVVRHRDLARLAAGRRPLLRRAVARARRTPPPSGSPTCPARPTRR